MRCFILGCFMICCMACKTVQKVQVSGGAENVLGDTVQRVPYLLSDSIQFWSARTKVTYTANGKSQNLKANIRIKKDKIIWVSITPEIAILEAFRVYLTPDEITIVNFLNKEYYQEDFEFVQRFLKMNIQFEDLQQTLMQRLTFLYPTNQYNALLYEQDTIFVYGNYKQYLEEFKRSKTYYEDVHYVTVEDLVIRQSLWYKPENNAELVVNFQQRGKTDSGFLYFKEAQMDITAPTKQTILQLVYSNVRVNEELEFPLTVPESYSRMSILLD